MSDFSKKFKAILRRNLYPTEQDREVRRWIQDKGDQTLRFDYDLKSDSLVLDLGGYNGQWASDLYSRYNCQIMVFEAIKPFAQNIEKRFAKNSKITVFPAALGAKKRKESMALDDTGSSVFREAKESSLVQFEDIAEIFTRQNISQVDLMKINIEGGEYEVLPRLFETNLISTIKNIQIQFHNIFPDSKRQMQKLQATLTETHFPTYQYTFVWENWKIRE